MNQHPSGLLQFRNQTQRQHRYPVAASVVSGLVACVDSLVVIGTGIVAYLTVFGGERPDIGTYSAAICFVWIISVLLFHLAGLYRFDAINNPVAVIDRIVVAFLATFLFLTAAFSINDAVTLSTEWTVAFGALSGVSIIALRFGVANLALRLSRVGVLRREVVIAGTAPQVERLLTFLQRTRPDFIDVVGAFVDGDTRQTILGTKVFGRISDTAMFLRRSLVNDVIVALPWSAEAAVHSTIDELHALPINVYLASDFIHPDIGLREPPEHFAGLPLVPVHGHPLSGWRIAVKAIEDYTLAALALAVLAPLMILIAIAVKIDSPGPIIFRQRRLGFNNQVFEIFKFRSMIHTEKQVTKTLQAKENDPRFTRLGSFLRRSSLDELPQLLNVLNGTMSLVGPRPHAIDHNEDYSRLIRGYFARHRVKPGITGWAQVNGLRGETDTTAKMQARVTHDVFYTDNWSLAFDIRILLQTVVALLGARNAI